MNQTETNLARIRAYNKALDAEWDESKHSRAANGQFSSEGSSNTSRESWEDKPHKYPRGIPSGSPARRPLEKRIGEINNAMIKVEGAINKIRKTNKDFLDDDNYKKLMRQYKELLAERKWTVKELDGPSGF